MTLYVTDTYYGIRYGCCEWRGGKAPRQAAGHDRRAGLPAHPDFKHNQPDPDVIADTLITRAQGWNDDYVVVDHGGGSPLEHELGLVVAPPT